ncbi:ribbon-helix-helix domain-containing protein [Antarcticirhabdus aurantiaca]|uniref:Ribbon-helix-helix domain-containing protein n=1 Tax=Antarcticirhabdus aurantiaca TaxID=2606717 RepID=A0ACD4NI57_9HYPH|nr:ribbon-helix-helix domain-containing protein [Antarcticirhabdus aurantiaca]WAJ26500.1 ribbon-helix-helix domain-containing protein [Jeongeuplla avenae]
MSGKRSVSIRGHRTSFSVEDRFFAELSRIARERSLSLAELVAHVDEHRPAGANLSSAIRLFVVDTLIAERDVARATAPSDQD